MRSYLEPVPNFEFSSRAILDSFVFAKVQTSLAKVAGIFSPNLVVKTEDLGPLRQNFRTSVGPNLAFAYDLSTPPEVERIESELLAAFLRQPDNLDVLLKDVSNRIEQAFERRKK